MKIKKGDIKTVVIADTGHEVWGYPDGKVCIPGIENMHIGSAELVFEAAKMAVAVAMGRIEI